MPKTAPPLSAVLPPLVFGSATFNTQFVPDPFALPATDLVARALAQGVRAFDTSPYYGPSEGILGRALAADAIRARFPRESYFLLTKVGRLASASFDYSPAWVRASIARSLARLRTDYLDVVYCHDVEFVSPEEVLAAVRELRRIRDTTGTVRYVGISGYPVGTLCALAELVLERTGEPLDAVLSYANYTLQNRTLLDSGIARLRAAGVDVVPNASILGMGLLRRKGVPIGGQGDWHPAPAGLRQAVQNASEWVDTRGERLEKVAIRSAVESWWTAGAIVGACGDPTVNDVASDQSSAAATARGVKRGVSVMGVSSVEELEETMRVWRSVMETVEGGPGGSDREWGLQRREEVEELARGVREVLGEWADVSWDSPGNGFVNQADGSHWAEVEEADFNDKASEEVAVHRQAKEAGKTDEQDRFAQLPTPPGETTE